MRAAFIEQHIAADEAILAQPPEHQVSIRHGGLTPSSAITNRARVGPRRAGADTERAPFILEGNPDTKQPLSRKELTARLMDPTYAGYRVLPDRTVKIKQHQDNVQFAAMVEAVDQSFGRILAKLAQRRFSRSTTALLRLGVNSLGLLQSDGEDLVLAA